MTLPTPSRDDLHRIVDAVYDSGDEQMMEMLHIVLTGIRSKIPASILGGLGLVNELLRALETTSPPPAAGEPQKGRPSARVRIIDQSVDGRET